MPKANFRSIFSSFFFATIALVALFLLSSSSLHAASLSILPTASKATVGNIVSVKVLVATDGKPINNSETTIQFPVDLLEVVSLNKSSSIFSMWVEDPKFSNVAGKITLNGGLPNPGFIGQSGEILSIVFKAKKQGTASVVISDSAVRQNDGLGTDILTSKQNAIIQIEASSGVDLPALNIVSSAFPAKPIINSSTHPEQNIWYKEKTASFNWSVPNDVTSIQTLLSKNINAIPTVTYDGSVSERTVKNISDGVYYFNVRYMNNVGWGSIAHYKVQIDSTPPEKFILNVKNFDSKDIVILNAVDMLSGIDSYSVKIDDSLAVPIKKDSLINNEYVLPTQNQGEHTLSVTAYDKAGNQTESKTSYFSSPILPPTVTVTPTEITRGDAVKIYGNSKYSDTIVEISVQTSDKQIKSYSTRTNSEGFYSISSDNINTTGSTLIWVQLVFSNTIKSPFSDKVTIQVNDNLIVKTSKSVIYTLYFVIPLLVLILLLVFISYFGWHKFFGLKKRLNRETEEAVYDIHRVLMMYKDELSRQLKKLEKIKDDRDLNRKEGKIFKELQNNIDGIEEFIDKKLRKIK